MWVWCGLYLVLVKVVVLERVKNCIKESEFIKIDLQVIVFYVVVVLVDFLKKVCCVVVDLIVVFKVIFKVFEDVWGVKDFYGVSGVFMDFVVFKCLFDFVFVLFLEEVVIYEDQIGIIIFSVLENFKLGDKKMRLVIFKFFCVYIIEILLFIVKFCLLEGINKIKSIFGIYRIELLFVMFCLWVFFISIEVVECVVLELLDEKVLDLVVVGIVVLSQYDGLDLFFQFIKDFQIRLIFVVVIFECIMKMWLIMKLQVKLLIVNVMFEFFQSFGQDIVVVEVVGFLRNVDLIMDIFLVFVDFFQYEDMRMVIEVFVNK